MPENPTLNPASFDRTYSRETPSTAASDIFESLGETFVQARKTKIASDVLSDLSEAERDFVSQDVISGDIDTPEKEAMKGFSSTIARLEAARRQGAVSESQLALRKEKILREHQAKYPRLAAELQALANSSGRTSSSLVDAKRAEFEFEREQAEAALQELDSLAEAVGVDTQLKYEDPSEYYRQVYSARSKLAQLQSEQFRADLATAKETQLDYNLKLQAREEIQHLRELAPAYEQAAIMSTRQIMAPLIGSSEQISATDRSQVIAQLQNIKQNSRRDILNSIGSDTALSQDQINSAMAPINKIVDSAITLAENPDISADMMRGAFETFKYMSIYSDPTLRETMLNSETFKAVMGADDISGITFTSSIGRAELDRVKAQTMNYIFGTDRPNGLVDPDNSPPKMEDGLTSQEANEQRINNARIFRQHLDSVEPQRAVDFVRRNLIAADKDKTYDFHTDALAEFVYTLADDKFVEKWTQADTLSDGKNKADVWADMQAARGKLRDTVLTEMQRLVSQGVTFELDVDEQGRVQFQPSLQPREGGAFRNFNTSRAIHKIGPWLTALLRSERLGIEQSDPGEGFYTRKLQEYGLPIDAIVE